MGEGVNSKNITSVADDDEACSIPSNESGILLTGKGCKRQAIHSDHAAE